MPLTVNIPETVVTIPLWVVYLIPVLIGSVCMWMSGRCERLGVQAMQPNAKADKYFRRMGTWRVVAYVMLVVYLLLLS